MKKIIIGIVATLFIATTLLIAGCDLLKDLQGIDGQDGAGSACDYTTPCQSGLYCNGVCEAQLLITTDADGKL